MTQIEELRKVAERILVGQNHPASVKEHADMNKILYELSVHQIELEIQNEELRAAKIYSDQIQQHLAQLYHQAPVGYVSLTEQAIIIEANQTFSQFLAIPLEHLYNKSITQFMPDAEKNVFLRRYHSFYQQPADKEIETCLLTPDRKTVQVRLDGRRSKQTVTGLQEKDILLICVTNISEIKKNQQLLLEAKEEAEQANQAKSQFLSQMSHNLRTPLNAILGFSQLLELYQPVPLDVEQNEYIGHIIDAGNYLLELINDVLNFATLEAGQIKISADKINVYKLLNQLIEVIAPEAAQKNISLHYQPCEINLDVHLAADATRVKEILLNLLSNAIKYNRKDGSIHLSYQLKNESCRIFVKDSGIGLSQEQQQHLFKPFDRLGMETSGIEGTGIGLVICKRLVEAMNGMIGVESLQGEGSSFWIDLPLSYEQANEEAAATPTASQAETRHCAALYIEDNPTNMNLMEAYFMGQKTFTLLKATDAHQGLELAQNHQPDVILLDIQLPEMDGFKVFQHLKNNQSTQHIPVIAVSAYAMQQDINKAMQLGFYDYITKPFNFKNLLTTINTAVNLNSATSRD